MRRHGTQAWPTRLMQTIQCVGFDIKTMIAVLRLRRRARWRDAASGRLESRREGVCVC
jgi:hypothetical protein